MRIQWLEWLTIVLSLISATVAVITVLGCEKMVDSSSHYILGVGVPALVASTIVL